MLSNKEITKRFDVPKSTLYSWRTERPKVYDYLANADDQYEKYRKVNILLENYIETTNIHRFTYQEIEFIINLNLSFTDNFEAKDIQLYYAEATQKANKLNDNFSLDIIKKLSSLNLIEKYIFCERLETIYKMIKPRSDEKADLIQHYFKEFLEIV